MFQTNAVSVSKIFNTVQTLKTCTVRTNKLFYCIKSLKYEAEKSNNNTGPLRGIRVLDMTRVLAGPYCTMMLGDLGAEIIKIERPKIGDDTRSWKPPSVKDTSCYFLSVNRNKKSVCVDFSKPEGVDVLHSLAKECDVFIENFIPGNLKKKHLDYDTLKKINPKLIYCSLSGYGSSGPYKNRPGYDVIVSAVGGLMSTTGPRDGPACKTGVALTDLLTGLQAYGAISSALYARQHTNRGQHIECSLLESQISALVNLGSNSLNAGIDASRWGTAHESIAPYQSYDTSDTCIIIAALNNVQFKTFCDILYENDEENRLDKDPRFKDNEHRVLNRIIMNDAIQKKFKTKPTNEWMELFSKTNIACGPVNTVSQALNDPQVLARDMVVELEHSTAGKIKVLGMPVKYSETKPTIRSPPPVLGEHTHLVLRDILKYDDSKFQQLQNSKIIE